MKPIGDKFNRFFLLNIRLCKKFRYYNSLKNAIFTNLINEQVVPIRGRSIYIQIWHVQVVQRVLMMEHPVDVKIMGLAAPIAATN